MGSCLHGNKGRFINVLSSLCPSSFLSLQIHFMRGGRVSLGANLSYEKLLRSNLGDDTTTFLLEGVFVLCNAFDKSVLLHSSLDVFLDFLAAFRCLEQSETTWTYFREQCGT